MDEAEVIALLKESNRQQRNWLIVVLVGAVVLAVVLIAVVPGVGTGAPLALAGVGVLLGVLITAPQRRLLARLGLTREQAIELLRRPDTPASS